MLISRKKMIKIGDNVKKTLYLCADYERDDEEKRTDKAVAFGIPNVAGSAGKYVCISLGQNHIEQSGAAWYRDRCHRRITRGWRKYLFPAAEARCRDQC